VKAIKEYLKVEKRKEQLQKGKGKNRYPESESVSEEEDSADEYVITNRSSKPPKVPKPTYKPKQKDSYSDYLKYVNPLLLMSKLSTKEAKKQRDEEKKVEEKKTEAPPKPQLQNPIASELKRKIIDM
jgi:hypothetical protein